MKVKRSYRFGTALNYIFLVIISCTFLFPFWRVLAISLNDGVDALAGGINFWPRKFTLDNYMVIFSKPDILNAYKITILRTVIGTLLSVFLMSLMAYGLSKKHLIGRKVFNVLILITMFFSGGIIPFYLLLKRLQLLNNFWVYVIPSLYQAWNIILLRTFFSNLPASIEESARMDGANDIILFFKIVLPISLPIIATVSLFVSVGHWNDWFAGEFYIQNKELVPLQTLLIRIIRANESTRIITDSASYVERSKVSNVTSYSIKMAVLVAAVLPIMCIYPFLQKYFIKGVMVGSIKG